jgi:hypothetical protein
MTPTLSGRWQTRLLLYIFIGLPVTLLFALYNTNWQLWPPLWDRPVFFQPFLVITCILVLGLILDPVYIQLQRFHWDQDWPFSHQFFFSIVEFLIVWYAIDFGLLDILFAPRPEWNEVVYHFSTVFILSFLAILGGCQIFLVRWRFKGGELGRFPVQ